MTSSDMFLACCVQRSTFQLVLTSDGESHVLIFHYGVVSHKGSVNFSFIYIRGRQSPAREPNPAREFRPSASFNNKFGPENVRNDERLFSRWVWFSRTLIDNADRHSYTRWRVDADWLPLGLHLTFRLLV